MGIPNRLDLGAPASCRPRRMAGVQEQPLGDEVLLCDPVGGQVGILNRTGYFIWQRCDGAHTMDDIARAVRAGFSGTQAYDIEADIWETLRTLWAAGLLIATPQSESPHDDP